jgi:predicted enzyme related to lactoylglutathione lyase
VIRVDDLAAATSRVLAHGGTVVVEAFSVPGVGTACYVTDPAGLLLGLHAYDGAG